MMPMKNPYDQFDEKPKEVKAPNPDAVKVDNVYDKVEDGLTTDQFSSELYRRLRANEPKDAIVEWARQNGREIAEDEGFLENVKIRDSAAAQGFLDQVQFGRVDESGMGGRMPGATARDAAAMVRSAGNAIVLGLGDDLVSAGHAAIQPGSFKDNYKNNWTRWDQQRAEDEAVRPAATYGGDVIGAVASMKYPGDVIGAVGREFAKRTGGKTLNLATRAGIGATAGGTEGAIAAAGYGDMGNRLEDVPAGATIGMILGGGFPLLGAAFRRLSRPIRERLFGGGDQSLAERAALTPEELQAAEAEMKRQMDLGLEPSLIDVLPERARNIIGTAGRRGPAREALQEEAERRTTQLPERVNRVADEEIRPAGETRSAEDFRRGIVADRSAEIEAALDPIRKTVLPMTEDIADVLGTKVGQRAIQDVIDETTDPAERALLQELQQKTKELAASVDPRLPEATQQRMQGQLLSDIPFNINASERIGRRLNQMADAESRPTFREFGRTVRSGAEVSPRYREAMADFRTRSQSVDALSVGDGARDVLDDNGNLRRVTDRGQGKGFLDEDPERFARRVEQLSEDIPIRVEELSPKPPKGSIRVNDTEQYDGNTTVYNATYTAPDGTEIEAFINYDKVTNTARIGEIGEISNHALNANQGGPRLVYDMIRAFQTVEPDVKSFVGMRVTGAKARSRNTRQDVPVPRRTRERPIVNTRTEEEQMVTRVTQPEDNFGLGEEALQRQRGMAAGRAGGRPASGLDVFNLGEEAVSVVAGREGSNVNDFVNRLAGMDERTIDRVAANLNTERNRQWIADTYFDGNIGVVTNRIDEIMTAVRSRRNNTANRTFSGAELDRVVDEAFEAIQGTQMQRDNFRRRYPSFQSNLENRNELLELLYGEVNAMDPIAVSRTPWGADEDELYRRVGQLLSQDGDTAFSRLGNTASEAAPTQPTTQTSLETVVTRTPAPSERDLARVGAADAVAERANRGPRQARSVAEQFSQSPAQRQRSATLLDRPERTADRMKGEVERVKRVIEETTSSGPRAEGGVAGVEGLANSLYTPGPISFTRETMRFLNRIGMTENDALEIVQNAIDPAQTERLIGVLQKYGMNREQAAIRLENIRSGLTRYVNIQESPEESANAQVR